MSRYTILCVDDEENILSSLERVFLEEEDCEIITANGGEKGLEVLKERPVDLIISDQRMPGMSGLTLQDKLAAENIDLPIIFITGHGDVPMAVDAMQKGAVDFIQKPFRDQELLDRIREALATDEERREAQQQHAEVALRLDRLTNREREVFELVVTGKPNKVIAYELGVSQRTVEIHRARVMEKMQARSLADLVKMHMTA